MSPTAAPPTPPHGWALPPSGRSARRRQAWTATTAVALALTVASVIASQRVTVPLRLSPGVRVPADRAFVAMAASALVLTLLARKQEWLGLLGLSALSFGAAGCWLLLDSHRLAGPVILAVSNAHGIHLGDLAAAAPATVGLGLLAMLAHRAYQRVS